LETLVRRLLQAVLPRTRASASVNPLPAEGCFLCCGGIQPCSRAQCAKGPSDLLPTTAWLVPHSPVEVDGVADNRPFLVAGQRMRAPISEGCGWHDPLSVAPLPPEHADVVLRRWLALAGAEHAAGIAFSRFALVLAHHGAPEPLLSGAHRAALEELRHARGCFSLVSAWEGKQLRPGCLDMSMALEGELAPEQMVRTLVREGCVGETVCAAQAAEAAALTQVPAAKALLTQIADDEVGHVALAWRALRWAVALYPETRDVARAAFAEVPDAPREPLAGCTVEPGAEAYGVLSCAHAERVRLTVLEQVVRPLAERVLGAADGTTAAPERPPEDLAQPTGAAGPLG
jgi:hypothetical protein